MSNIQQLQDRVKKFGVERHWETYHQPKDIAIDIIEEASELLEHFQWKNGLELEQYVAAHKEDIEDELMDVLHGVLLMANTMHIDVMNAFERKMKKNEIKYPVVHDESDKTREVS